jgi:hypothetical protein
MKNFKKKQNSQFSFAHKPHETSNETSLLLLHLLLSYDKPIKVKRAKGGTPYDPKILHNSLHRPTQAKFKAFSWLAGKLSLSIAWMWEEKRNPNIELSFHNQQHAHKHDCDSIGFFAHERRHVRPKRTR